MFALDLTVDTHDALILTGAFTSTELAFGTSLNPVAVVGDNDVYVVKLGP